MDNRLKQARRLGKVLNALSAVSPALAGRTAFRIFCSPRRLPLRDADQKFLSGAQAFTFRLGKQHMQGYTWAGGTPGAREVLCLHGWESSSARWKQYVKGMLEAGFTVHAFDAPASGRSGGNMLNAMVYSRAVQQFVALKGAPYAIVGHSLGAAAAVLSATMLDTPRPARMALLGAFAESTRVIRDFGAIMGINETVLEGVFREITRRSGIPVSEYSITQKAALLTDVQGLVLHDRDDDVAPVAEGRAIAAAWNVPFFETRGLGHRMQDKTVSAEVIRFLLHT